MGLGARGDMRVWSLLLGGALPAEFVGKSTDASNGNREYTHYSTMTTVEENWGLPNLGYGDAKAESFLGMQVDHSSWPSLLDS